MVDVAGESGRLPIDPDVKVPDSVRRRAEAVDAFYKQNGQQPPAVAPAAAPAAPDPQAAAAPLVAPPATPPPPAGTSSNEPIDLPNPLNLDLKRLDPNDQSWQKKFLEMQGRYNASQKTIGEMQEQMEQLGNELIQTQQRQPPQTPQTPQTPRSPQTPRYVTDEDIQNYGTDLADFAGRVALQAVAPRLSHIQEENQELKNQLRREAKHRMDQALDVGVPNWREVNNNQRFHSWLRLPDIYSNQIRQTLLDEAVAAAHAPRVISFFKGFLAEERATGHVESAPSQPAAPPRDPAVPLVSLAAPGGLRPATGGETSLPADRPTYTRARIAELYRMNRKGAFVGREAEWARQEQDIIAAGREGRVIG